MQSQSESDVRFIFLFCVCSLSVLFLINELKNFIPSASEVTTGYTNHCLCATATHDSYT